MREDSRSPSPQDAVRDPELRKRGHDEAASNGLVVALTLLHGVLGPDTVAGGVRGHVIAPVAVARTARRVWTGERYADLTPSRSSEAGPVLLDGSGLTTLRWEPPQSAGRPHAAGPRDWDGWWGTALAWVRLGHSRQLFGLAAAHLGQRTFSGSPLLQQQMVKGTVADATVEHLEIESALVAVGSDALSGTGLRHWHDRLTEVDRMLLRLLGARGYAAAGPARAAYASELLCDVYVRPHGGYAAVGGEL
ncbi:hypothetical protein ABZ471_22515 [Streptomyces sp. NPDC005728]|uniref:hypothetical protein n=1 Tax=Streptomyces sp. NPDC005728 TaxID=3157054 RepID=UPI0033D0D59D